MDNHGESMAKKPNILLISLPYQGHISPVMQFAKRLSSKGVGVTIVTPFSANIISDNKNNAINIEHVSYDADEGEIILSVEDYMANFEKRASDKLVQVIEKQKSYGHTFDVLVHDSLMPWGVDFGHEHGLKAAVFFTQACAISAIYYLVNQGKIEYPVEEGADLSFLPDEIPISNVKDLPYDLYDERYPGTLDMLASQFLNVQNADWIFFNNFLGLEDEKTKDRNESELRKMRTPHILLISLPFQGHFSPMMQFSKRLASKGLQVTMVCPSFTIVPNNSIHIEYITYENDQTATTVEGYMANIEKQASDKLVQVIEKQRRCGHPFEVLVHDSLMSWAVDLGHQHGLRVASFFTQACAVSAIFYFMFQGKLKFPVEEGSSLSFLSSLIPIEDVKDLPSDVFQGEQNPGVLDLLANQFSHVHKDDWILCNTFLELENEVSLVECISSVNYYKILLVPLL